MPRAPRSSQQNSSLHKRFNPVYHSGPDPSTRRNRVPPPRPQAPAARPLTPPPPYQFREDTPEVQEIPDPQVVSPLVRRIIGLQHIDPDHIFSPLQPQFGSITPLPNFTRRGSEEIIAILRPCLSAVLKRI